MRITIATGPNFPVPALKGGAIPRVWQGLAEAFAGAGHTVRIMACAHPDQPAEEEIRGVRYHRWGGYPQSLSIWRDLRRNLGYSLRLVRRLPPADILVTNDFWLPVTAGRRPSCGRIVVSANRFPKRQYRLYRKAALVAAASREIGDQILSQTPALEGRVEVFPNPIDTTLFAPPEGGRRGVGSGSSTLLFVGRVHPEKGLRRMVEAFATARADAPDWKLRVVGPWEEPLGGGGDAFRRELEAAAHGQPVSFVGPIFDPVQLAGAYRGADLFCYPSVAERGEALPVAPLEAMAAGLPPVVSALRCFTDYIDEGETGFVFDHRAGDPAGELARLLGRLMGEPGLVARCGKKARERALEFDFAAVGRRLLVRFERLVDGVELQVHGGVPR